MFNSIEQTTSTATYCSSALCVGLAFINEYAAAFGVIIAVATFATNLYFQRKKDKRETRRR